MLNSSIIIQALHHLKGGQIYLSGYLENLTRYLYFPMFYLLVLLLLDRLDLNL